MSSTKISVSNTDSRRAAVIRSNITLAGVGAACALALAVGIGIVGPYVAWEAEFEAPGGNAFQAGSAALAKVEKRQMSMWCRCWAG